MANPFWAISVLAQQIWAKTNTGLRGPEGWGREGWEFRVFLPSEGWGGQTQKKWGPEGWAQNFALFRPSPAPFSLFLSFSGGLLVEFWWCLKRRGSQMSTFGVLGLSCEAPAAPKPPGFHTTTRDPKRAHLRVSVFTKTTKFNEKTPRERQKERKWGAGEGEKKAKFWAVRWRAVWRKVWRTHKTQHATRNTQHATHTTHITALHHHGCFAQCNHVTLGRRPPIQPSAVGDRSLMWPCHITGTPGCSTPKVDNQHSLG